MKKIVIFLSILLLLTGCSNKNERVVNILNWSSYIPTEVLMQFEKESGIKVNYGTYSSNEELLAKVSNTKSGTYDLIFPSDYMVEIMIGRNMLEKIDKTKLNNFSNLNEKYLGLDFDIKNDYSIPFLMAYTTIAIDTSQDNNPITSYNDLLNPRYKNSIVLVDDQRIIIGMALLALGYNMNSKDERELNDAKLWLLKLKPNIKAYDSDSPKNFIITKEAKVGVIWNAESVLAKLDNDSVRIIEPKEGFALSMDNFTIPKDAKNVSEAYEFIDFILRKDVMKSIVEGYPYKSVNIEAEKLLDLDFQSTIDDETLLSSGHFVKNIGDSIKKYDRVWIEIK